MKHIKYDTKSYIFGDFAEKDLGSANNLEPGSGFALLGTNDDWPEISYKESEEEKP